MKNCTLGVVTCFLLAVSAAQAQPPDAPKGPPRGGRADGPGAHRPGGTGPHRHFPPHSMGLFGLLDTDHDGMLNSQEVADAAQALRKLDGNNDGNVTASEAFQGMTKMARESHGSRERHDRASGEWRPDQRPRRDGEEDRGREFRPQRTGPEGARRPGGPGPDGPIAPRFAERLMQLDADEDGKLSADELPERLSRMMGELDTNGDGELDADELKAFTDRVREQRQGDPRGRRRPPAETSDTSET